MNSDHAFNPRSDAPSLRSGPGMGDDTPCVKCAAALDTGLECTECGHDNWQAVTGEPSPFTPIDGVDSEGGEL